MTVHESLPATLFLEERVPVEVEVFSVFIQPDGYLQYLRAVGTLGMACTDPDSVARELATIPPCALHSTSWRWEPSGRLVLTYIALVAAPIGGVGKSEMVHVLDLDAAPKTDPEKPRPRDLPSLAIVTHGLRHLAFLLRDPTQCRLREAISGDAARVLENLATGLAGKITSPSSFGAS